MSKAVLWIFLGKDNRFGISEENPPMVVFSLTVVILSAWGLPVISETRQSTPHLHIVTT